MGILKKLIAKFTRQTKSAMTIVPFQRNETCFCGSGLKYKKCHQLKLEPKNKVACKLFEDNDKAFRVTILKKDSTKIKSNLRWVDIGVRSNNSID
jgi:SEC-C motif